MTDLDLALALRSRLTDPAVWTQGAYGRRRSGATAHWSDSNVTCRCLSGWIRHVAAANDVSSLNLWARFEARVDCQTQPEIRSVARWNDAAGRTFEDVVRLVDEVIGELRAEVAE